MLTKLFSESRGTAGAIFRILANARSTSLNHELLGNSVTGAPFQVRREDGVAYAAATNDQHAAYSAPDGVAPPLFAVKILAGPIARLLLHRDLGMNLLRMLHGEQAFTFLKPLRYGRNVIPTATITGFREVGTGEILDMSLDIRTEDNEKLLTGSSSFFLTKGGGEKGKGAGKKAAPDGAPFPADAPGHFSRAFETDKGQPTRYAAASGDRNPIHTNNTAARLAGLPRPIMHGLCMMALAGREVLAMQDADPTSLRELSLRFARPAFPGSRYVILGANAADRGVDFVVLDEKDRPILSRGHAVLK